jgi:hypothetical protein
MGAAIGQILPMAVGVALSPLPIIAVVLMLTTPSARSNGPAFLFGWLGGLAVVGVIVLVIAGPRASGDGGQPPAWVGWLQLGLGVALAALAVRQYAGRPRTAGEVTLPPWMQTIDHFTAVRSLGVGALLAGANPKNLLLSVAAATAIAQTGVPGGQQAVAYGIFGIIGTTSIATPVIIYLTMGRRSADLLARMKDWTGRNNAVIMAVLCAVIGAKLVGDGISSLTG